MSRKNLKISVSGVRGIVGEALTPALVSSFAAAFGQYVGHGRVIVGRDTRVTGDMYERAVVAGLLSVGCQPVLIGIVPTPTVQMVVEEYNANGGIAITASHNPIEWNALKLIGRSGVFLTQCEAKELLDIYNQPHRNYACEEEFRNIRKVDNTFLIHENKIFANVNTGLIKSQNLRVAVDCCNGAGAPYTVAFLKKLGCDVFAVNTKVDGVFHRRPEPIPENLTELSQAVIDNGCDIGFAQDPDADRIVVVDEFGSPIGEQNSIVLATEHLLSRKSGKVVVNIQTTKSVADIAEKYNSECVYTPVGEINVTSRMLDENAVIGGEGGSGGIIFPQVHPCRDSFTGMALILELLSERGQTLRTILNELPLYASAGAKISISSENALKMIRALIRKYQNEKVSTIDGLRIDWTDAWILIRSSNTEPIVRVYAEAKDLEKADELACEFIKEIEAYVGLPE